MTNISEYLWARKQRHYPPPAISPPPRRAHTVAYFAVLWKIKQQNKPEQATGIKTSNNKNKGKTARKQVLKFVFPTFVNDGAMAMAMTRADANPACHWASESSISAPTPLFITLLIRLSPFAYLLIPGLLRPQTISISPRCVIVVVCM